MVFFNCCRGCSEGASVVVPLREEISECSICLEAIYNQKVRCTNVVNHFFHDVCVDRYASRFFTNEEVECPLKCGGVFRGIFGVQEPLDLMNQEERVQEVVLDVDMRAAVEAAMQRYQNLPLPLRGMSRMDLGG